MHKHRKLIEGEDLQLGGIVGVAELVDVVEDHRSKWFEGPFAFVLRKPRPLKFIPCKGQLGIWTVPARLRSRLR
jgi:hypothetical protein